MTVYKIGKNKLKIAPQKYAFYFPDSESLTKAVLFLIKIPKTEICKSSLYSLKNKYVLITDDLCSSLIDALNEFCFKKTNNVITIEHIKEYGKPLITNNAIIRYGVAFSKTKVIL